MEGRWKFLGGGVSEVKIPKGRGGSVLAFFPEGGKQVVTNKIILL